MWERLSLFHNSAVFTTDMSALQRSNFSADGLLANHKMPLLFLFAFRFVPLSVLGEGRIVGCWTSRNCRLTCEDGG